MHIAIDVIVAGLLAVVLLVGYVDSAMEAPTAAGQGVAGSEFARMLAVDTLEETAEVRWSAERLEDFVATFDHVDLRMLHVSVGPTSDGAHGLEVRLHAEGSDGIGCVHSDGEGWPTYVDRPCSALHL